MKKTYIASMLVAGCLLAPMAHAEEALGYVYGYTGSGDAKVTRLTETYLFDAHNRPVYEYKLQWQNGQIHKVLDLFDRQYDANGRVTSEYVKSSQAPSATSVNRRDYTYNEKGQPSGYTVTNINLTTGVEQTPYGSAQFEYNTDGRLSKETVISSGGDYFARNEYEYNTDGTIKKLTDNANLANGYYFETTYTYNENGLLTEMLCQQVVTSTSEVTPSQRTSYTYDRIGNILSVSVETYVPAGKFVDEGYWTNKSQTNYDYDSDFRVTGRTELTGNGSGWTTDYFVRYDYVDIDPAYAPTDLSADFGSVYNEVVLDFKAATANVDGYRLYIDNVEQPELYTTNSITLKNQTIGLHFYRVAAVVDGTVRNSSEVISYMVYKALNAPRNPKLTKKDYTYQWACEFEWEAPEAMEDEVLTGYKWVVGQGSTGSCDANTLHGSFKLYQPGIARLELYAVYENGLSNPPLVWEVDLTDTDDVLVDNWCASSTKTVDNSGNVIGTTNNYYIGRMDGPMPSAIVYFDAEGNPTKRYAPTFDTSGVPINYATGEYAPQTEVFESWDAENSAWVTESQNIYVNDRYYRPASCTSQIYDSEKDLFVDTHKTEYGYDDELKTYDAIQSWSYTLNDNGVWIEYEHSEVVFDGNTATETFYDNDDKVLRSVKWDKNSEGKPTYKIYTEGGNSTETRYEYNHGVCVKEIGPDYTTEAVISPQYHPTRGVSAIAYVESTSTLQWRIPAYTATLNKHVILRDHLYYGEAEATQSEMVLNNLAKGVYFFTVMPDYEEGNGCIYSPIRVRVKGSGINTVEIDDFNFDGSKVNVEGAKAIAIYGIDGRLLRNGEASIDLSGLPHGAVVINATMVDGTTRSLKLSIQ